MLYANGQVLAVKDDSYTNKDAISVPQITIAIFDPASGELQPALITYGSEYASNVANMRVFDSLQGKTVKAKFRIMAFKNGGFKLLGTELPKLLQAAPEKAA